MITDYESLLCVIEDGRLWWLLKDVLRLCAGFLSGREDQTLETLLLAPDHRTLVNEQILIGDFDDAGFSRSVIW